MGLFEMILIPAVLGMVAMGSASGIRQTRRRKEMEHAERMKALEMGLVPQPSGLDWPAAAVCIAVGAGVPLGSFAVSWLATLTSDAPDEIWFAPVFVSFAAIGSARKLACRIIDPGTSPGNRRGAGRAVPPVGKPAIDPDAFDVVGTRG